MNKKVLTLCAGFLLAGGMLSSVSAENISKLTEGKYYKIVRTWERSSNSGDHAGWTVMEAGYYLGATSMDTDATLWKAEKNADGTISLVNMEGERFTLESEGSSVSNFTIDYNPSDLGKDETDPDFNQFKFGTNGILAQAASKDENGVWKLVAGVDNSSDFTEVKPQAFDAEATNLQEVANANAMDFFTPSGNTYVADGKTYRTAITVTTNGTQETLYIDYIMLKAAYNQNTKVWSFTYNIDGKPFEFGDETDFEMVQVGDDAILKLKSGKGYVKFNETTEKFELVDTIEKATILAFVATNTRVPVEVKVLNYYEKDGFTVEINGFDSKNEPTVDLAGNPLVGHLTPMVLTSNGEFKAVNNDVTSYYLKDENGNYIVATKYDVEGEWSSQALYNFTTVSESVLKHNLERAKAGLEEQIYFGEFSAFVDEAALEENPKALDELTWFTVNVNPIDSYYKSWAELGRADIKDVPTLVATQLINTQFRLKPIHISLQPGNLVDWKEFLQAKFYTVEKVEKDGTNEKLTADYGKTRWTSGYGNELEGQFALEIVEVVGDNDVKANYYQFTNRETLNSTWTDIPVNALYTTDKEYTYKCAGETYVIKPVAEVSDADGYKRFSDSELNRQYRVAFSSEVFDAQAYLTEEHADAEDPNAHVISLNPEKENSLVFNLKKYNAARDLNDEDKNTHEYTYHPTDSIYVISRLGFYNTKTKEQDFKYDTLKVVTYSFVNQFTEPLMYGVVEGVDDGVNDACYYSDVYANDTDKKKYESVAKAHEAAQKFAVRYDGNSKTKYNLRPVVSHKDEFLETEYGKTKSSKDLYQEFYIDWKENKNRADWNKVYAGDVALGILDNTELYNREENDLFVIEETESQVYRRLANNVDTISIYRNNNEKALLYEKTMKINDTTSVNFLGLENIADFTEMAPAMIADTAYVRNDTYKPQYMLIVDPTIHPAGKWCDVCGTDDCEHAVPTPAWTEGRFLVNLKDSANAWADAHKHQLGNPYLNEENLPKLGFVQGIHRNDSLIIASDNKQIFVGDNNDNLAKFQFRYKDITEGSFVIETEGGYLKWMNGVVVVISDMTLADVYNVNEDESRQPTANEEISAEEATVSVVATDGAVIVKGAEGKNVIVSTILGKVVANEVLNSDNETIAAPAGIVVVSVDGESFKVAVK